MDDREIKEAIDYFRRNLESGDFPSGREEEAVKTLLGHFEGEQARQTEALRVQARYESKLRDEEWMRLLGFTGPTAEGHQSHASRSQAVAMAVAKAVSAARETYKHAVANVLTDGPAASADRIAELEAWQLAVAEHLGFVNRPEGQAGYEVADAETVIGYIRGVEKRADVLETSDPAKPTREELEYTRAMAVLGHRYLDPLGNDLSDHVAALVNQLEGAKRDAALRESIIVTLERTLDGPTGLRARFAQKSIESEARYDCHAGPGTTTPACGACVSCLHRTLTWVEAEKDKLAIRVSVLDGSACAEERAEGNGGCGMCAWCCKSALERAETAEIQNEGLRVSVELLTRVRDDLRLDREAVETRIRNAEAVGSDELAELECIPCAQLSGHAEPCVRGPVLRVLRALRERKP